MNTISEFLNKWTYEKSSLMDLSKSLFEYNNNAFEVVNTIVKQVTIPIALVLLVIFFSIEMMSSYDNVSSNGGMLTPDLYLPITIKYIVALICVTFSPQILDFIMTLGNLIVKLILKFTGSSTLSSQTFTFKFSGNFWDKAVQLIIGILAVICRAIMEFIIKILVAVRFIQLYILYAFAPLSASTMMSKEHKNVGTGLLKHFIAYVLQGAVIVVVLSLYGVIIGQSKTAEGLDTITQLFASIAQSIIFIVVIMGTLGISKKISGVGM